MQITAAIVKELRDKTGAGMMDCKKALTETNGDIDKAIDTLRARGIAKAEKKAGRSAKEGIIYSYIHPTGENLGVLVEINCETDFVAATDNFKAFAKDIAMQIAAMAPIAVKREEISAEIIEREKAVYKEQVLNEGKPEHIADRIIVGKLDKFYKENVLLEQDFFKDTDKNVETYLKETIGTLGENIAIARFARFKVGESAVVDNSEA
ncbi:MAG: translation elongation factor Ts [Candidatus Marinimicrobia bacterium]|nr:translation elongation factor Ts [Candidatus Neomarinimicrobiota bacterium]